MHLPPIDDQLPQTLRDYWSDDPRKAAQAASEVQLLRMAIPCVRLKVLKHGGVLSKMHSVCVPNKVTSLTSFPLDPARSGDASVPGPSRQATSAEASNMGDLCDV